MKSNTNKKMLFALALASLSFTSAVIAQDDLLSETDSILNNEQIDIDGDYERRRQTQADKLAKARKKLEQRNEDMVSKKIEDMRLAEELKLTNKLKDAFNGKATDSVSTSQSATQKVVVKEAPAPKKIESNNKVIPTVGITNLSGEGIEIESNISAGLAFESMVASRFSVGVAVNYTTFEMTDTSRGYVNNNYYNNGYYNQGYYNTYGQGREISYKNLGFEVNGKFFIAKDSKIRPYVGAGLGYNRTSMKYNSTDNYSYQSINYGSESYSSSFVNGALLLGSEVLFSDTIGASLEFKYSVGLNTDGENEGNRFDPNQNPDQLRLEALADAIESSTATSINAGLLVKF